MGEATEGDRNRKQFKKTDVKPASKAMPKQKKKKEERKYETGARKERKKKAVTKTPNIKELEEDSPGREVEERE